MNPLMYWIVFSLLVGLLVIFLSCIVFNIILDYCLMASDESPSKANHYDRDEEADETRHLNKYQFNKHDVEDLTRIQGNFKTVLHNVTITNEVDNSNIDQLLKKKISTSNQDALGSSISNIDEEDELKHSQEDISTLVGVSSELNRSVKGQKEISKSVDDLEFCDPRAIYVLKVINKIEEKAKKVEKEVDYFIGGTNNVKFYEINEQFLRLMISLCDVMCETAELQQRKTQTMEYIEECKRRLRDKAMNMT